MRRMDLTCPNCGARYRVAPDAIPPEGRTVRCPNCNASWFEQGGGNAPAGSEPVALAETLPPDPSSLIGHSGAVGPAGPMAEAHEIDGPAVEAELAIRTELNREGAPQPPPSFAPRRPFFEDEAPPRSGLGALTWFLLVLVIALGGFIVWGVMTGRITLPH